MSWSFQTAVVLCLIGVGVGAFGTLIGAGGGFILTPILLLLYPHDSAQTLTAISLTAVFFNAASGSAAYARQRRIDFRSGVVFALATLPGAIGGALFVGAVSRQVFDAIMGTVLALLAVWLLFGERWPLPTPQRHLQQRRLVDREGEEYAYSVPVRRGALYSLAIGFVSSFLGIGGGVIHVPLLVRALGFPTHIATATSHFVLAAMAGVGTLTHVALGSFSHGHGLRRATALSIGVVAGAQAGRIFLCASVELRSSGCSRFPCSCSQPGYSCRYELRPGGPVHSGLRRRSGMHAQCRWQERLRCGASRCRRDGSNSYRASELSMRQIRSAS